MKVEEDSISPNREHINTEVVYCNPIDLGLWISNPFIWVN